MAVEIKITPQNLLKWSNMEDWENGASAAPTNHTLTGAGASVARESTTIKQGTYSAAVTRAGADTTLYYDLPEYADYVSRKVTFGCWVYATVASRGRLSISDGVGSTNSSYHTGGSGWEYLEVTHDVDTSATRIRVEMQVNTGNTTVYFDGGVLVDGNDSGTVLTDIVDIGGWTPANRYRGQEFRVSRRQGLKIPSMFLESKTIKVSGQLNAASAATARTTLDSLAAAINTERFQPNTDKQLMDLYLFDDRFVRGHISNFDYDAEAALTVYNFSFNMAVPDPYFHYVQLLRSTNSISSTPQSFNMTVNGNAFSRPIFTVTNNGSNITSLVIENLTTNTSWTYTGTLATSSVLVVDTNDISVKNDGSDDYANAAGDLDMILVPGVNKINVTGLVNGTVSVDWFDRWY